MATIYGDWSKNCRLIIEYSYSQDINNCCTYVSMTLYAEKRNYTGRNYNNNTNDAYYNMNGLGNTYAKFDWSGSGWWTLGSSSFTVWHDGSTGAGGTTLYGNWHSGLTSSSIIPTDISISQYVSFPTIPRYANVSCSLNSKTVNSVKLNYSVDATIDYIRGRINGGSWINLSGNPVTFTGLAPATAYNLQLQVRRKDSQLWSESNTISVTTHDIAKITSASDYNIGTNTSISFTNPSGSTVNAWIEKGSSTDLLSSKRTGISTPYTFAWSASDNNLHYAATPNSNTLSVKFVLNTVCNGTNYYHTITKTATVKNANPTFSNYTYADVNSTTTALTGNNQKLIKGYSNVKTTISTTNKAVAQKSATMVKYRTEIGSLTKEGTYSSTAEVTMQVDKVTTGTIVVKAIDSRSNVTSVTKTATIVDYANVVIKNMSIVRQNGIGTTANIIGNGTYTNVNFGATSNAITKIEFRQKTKNGSFGSWTDITSKFTMSNGSFANNTTSNTLTGYAVGTEYVVEIRVTDKLSTATRTVEVTSGDSTLVLNRTKKMIGVGKIPDRTLPEGSGDFKGTVKATEIRLQKMRFKGISYILTTSAKISASTNYTVPFTYVVGTNDFTIYYEGVRLVRGTHFKEIGNSGANSTTIQFLWDVPASSLFEFVT